MSRALDWDKARARDRAAGGRVEPAVTAWWWTVKATAPQCHGCLERVPKNAPRAYNHYEQRLLCQICVEREGVVPRRSKAYLAWQTKGGTA